MSVICPARDWCSNQGIFPSIVSSVPGIGPGSNTTDQNKLIMVTEYESMNGVLYVILTNGK